MSRCTPSSAATSLPYTPTTDMNTLPKYRLKQYVNCPIVDGKDDFGTEIRFPQKDGNVFGEITAIYRHADRFVYAISGGWTRFYEEHISLWSHGYKPAELDEFVSDISQKTQSHISLLKRTITDQAKEIESLKAGLESHEITSLREVNDSMYKALSFYVDKANWSDGKIQGDLYGDSCANYYGQYGRHAREAMNRYDYYHREFDQPPIILDKTQ